MQGYYQQALETQEQFAYGDDAPMYKKWQFWVVLISLIIVIIALWWYVKEK